MKTTAGWTNKIWRKKNNFMKMFRFYFFLLSIVLIGCSPIRCNSSRLPQHDYFVLSPMEDQDMSVNWNPVEKYDLIISLPFCDYIQEVYYEIDTSKYAILSHCGNNGNAYIDEVDSLNPPGNKYSYIKLSEWLP